MLYTLIYFLILNGKILTQKIFVPFKYRTICAKIVEFKTLTHKFFEAFKYRLSFTKTIDCETLTRKFSIVSKDRSLLTKAVDCAALTRELFEPYKCHPVYAFKDHPVFTDPADCESLTRKFAEAFKVYRGQVFKDNSLPSETVDCDTLARKFSEAIKDHPLPTETVDCAALTRELFEPYKCHPVYAFKDHPVFTDPADCESLTRKFAEAFKVYRGQVFKDNSLPTKTVDCDTLAQKFAEAFKDRPLLPETVDCETLTRKFFGVFKDHSMFIDTANTETLIRKFTEAFKNYQEHVFKDHPLLTETYSSIFENQSQFLPFFPEIFLGSCLIFLLVCGSIIESSPKYNYPIICFNSETIIVLIWILLLCEINLYNTLTPYFVVDNLGSTAKIFLGLGLLGVLGVSKSAKIQAYEYYVLALSALLGLCFIASAQDFLSIYLGLELQTLSFYILASFQRYSAFSTEAGLKYFLLGAISSALLLFGISISYGFSGTTNLSHIASLFLEASEESQPYFKIIQVGLFFFSVGLFFKLGTVPFHGWLPDVYEGAPTSVTAIFSVIPKIAIFVVLIRFLNNTSPFLWNSLFLSLALLSLFVGSLASLYQTKIKRLLAYSGISHVGYALVGLSCGTLISSSASLFYILIYMVTSLFLWGLLLCVENKGGRSLYLSDVILWGRTNTVLAFTAILVVFSIAGIPPLGGFFAKFAIFASSIEASLYYGTLLGILTSSFGALYYLRLIKLLSFEEKTLLSSSVLSKPHALSMGLAAFFLVFFFLFGNFISYITYAISISTI